MRRFFMASPNGAITAVAIPVDVDAGMDLLLADGMDGEKAAEMMWAANRDGRDALAFAEHLIMLRRAFRGEK